MGKYNNCKCAFVASAVVGLANAAQAATATSTFQVAASVLSTCQVSSANIDFGTYDPLAAVGLSSNGNVQITCTLSTPYSIGFNTGSGDSTATRKMRSGSQTLNYALYRDLGRTLNWGDSIGTDTLAGIGTGLPVLHTVYAFLPSGQIVPNGTYSDTITVTVTY